MILKQTEKNVVSKQRNSPWLWIPSLCAAEEIPMGWLIRFVARPVTAFGVKGEPISTPWEFRAWGKNAKAAAAIARELNLPPYRRKKK